MEHAGTQEKIDRLLALEKIERKDLEIFDPLERGFLMRTIEGQLDTLCGEALDKFARKVHDIVDNDLLYDMNHVLIVRFVKVHLKEHGSLPDYTAVSVNVGLSRKTVAKHMKELHSAKRAEEHDEMLEVVVQEVIGMISQKALDGDKQAGKIILDVSHRKKTLAAMNMRERTYAMINKTVINWQVIERLTPEEIEMIENKFKEAWGRPGWGDWNWEGGHQGYKD